MPCMHCTMTSDIPWHRVVNAAGAISLRAVPGFELEQRLRLEAEGVSFNARGRVPLARYRWDGRRRPPSRGAIHG